MRFDAEAPAAATLRAELRRQAGPIYGDLDGYEVRDNVVKIHADMNPVSGPYAVKILLDLGGVYIDYQTSEPRDARLPAYVAHPWLALPWWKRAGIVAIFHLGVLSTALPKRTAP